MNEHAPCPWCRTNDAMFPMVNEVSRKWCIECVCGSRGPHRDTSDEAWDAWDAWIHDGKKA